MPPFWGKKTDISDAVDSLDILMEKAFELYTEGFKSPEIRARVRTMAEEALRLKAECYEAYVLLGLLEMEEDDRNSMQNYFLKALELARDPFNEYTWDWIVTCLDDNLHDYPRLAGYLTRFYDRMPEEFVARYLAKIYIKMNQRENALMILNEHLGANPESKLCKMIHRIERQA